MKHLSKKILDQFKQGGPLAFSVVFDEFYPQVLNFAKKITGDDLVADEIACNSFEKLFRYHQKFGTLNNIQAFLYITTRNASFDYLRKQKRQKRRMANWQSVAAQEYVMTPFDEAGYCTEVLELIYKEVEVLAPQMKRVFKLFYRDGYSIPEIAALLGISERTVRNQKNKAIKILREKVIDSPVLLAGLLFFYRRPGVL